MYRRSRGRGGPAPSRDRRRPLLVSALQSGGGRANISTKPRRHTAVNIAVVSVVGFPGSGATNAATPVFS